ncbi:MAG TPA: DNA mismatch repair protein MutS [Phycisphaerales bacterium]|nr:DNA mismatch repair protein MutS [Phycisphaerales bacterium]
MSSSRETPAMQQYYRFKRQHPGCVLLFRMGDFYETFDEDAVSISRALGLTLTKRTEGLPMAGVPYHQLENYLRRLVQQGFRVAVADQLQDPKEAKGIIDRGVTRVVTPGTLVDDSLLDGDAANTLAAIAFLESGEDSHAGIAFVEASTGDFVITDCPADQIADELARRSVGEIIYAALADGKTPPRVDRVMRQLGLSGTARPAWHFRTDEARELISQHFGVSTLAGYGLDEHDPAIPAAGAALAYLKETQAGEVDEGRGGSSPGREVVGFVGPGGQGRSPAEAAAKTAAAAASGTSRGRAEEHRLKARRLALAHLRPPRREDTSGRCIIDAVSLRSLEVERTIRGGGPKAAARDASGDGTLVGLFLGPGSHCCRTPMGRRLLREWLCQPLGRVEPILARQSAVAVFAEDRLLAENLRASLDHVQDVARITGRIALGRATPRDVCALGKSLASISRLIDLTTSTPALQDQHRAITSARAALEPLAAAIAHSCKDDPPAHMRDGGLFKDGFDADLDEARRLQTDAGSWLAEYQQRLVEKFDLPGLKVGYNKIFGYFIELPAAQARRAPDELTRKQTLKNAERYTTPELRDFENKVTTAEARAIEREKQLFEELCTGALAVIQELSAFAHAVAELDALQGLAERAVRRGWTRPEIVPEPVLRIHGGRHPVLEELLGATFVPNDVELGPGQTEAGASPASLALITGPNMAGKSTFIRQVALITLLAHVGSFVPADRATVGLVDRIFTRIGADDALHSGQSTFMVEMTETANILNHVTGRSLVILDEIGRGTSTLDGLSLAWSIAEFLAGDGESQTPGPRALFATHYHELTQLEERFTGRVKNLHVSVREWPSAADPGQSEIIFLHRILPGRTDQSYGIHVARLAGLPRPVVDRAREVLSSLAVHQNAAVVQAGGSATPGPEAAAAIPPARGRKPRSSEQFSLFTEYLNHPAIDQLREIKIEALSPMQAFDELRRIKAMTERTSE